MWCGARRVVLALLVAAGCAVFQVEDVDAATLVDADGNGAADVFASVEGVHGGLNPGACGFASVGVRP